MGIKHLVTASVLGVIIMTGYVQASSASASWSFRAFEACPPRGAVLAGWPMPSPPQG